METICAVFQCLHFQRGIIASRNGGAGRPGGYSQTGADRENARRKEQRFLITVGDANDTRNLQACIVGDEVDNWKRVVKNVPEKWEMRFLSKFHRFSLILHLRLQGNIHSRWLHACGNNSG